MSIIITGAAGFIGFHLSLKLLKLGHNIIGIDNLNNYYDPKLKKDRLKLLEGYSNFIFYENDISDKNAISNIFQNHRHVKKIIHLAAQAGVRYSLENPLLYIQSNVMGHTILLEEARTLKELEHFVYASSSSVYGASSSIPFNIDEKLNKPLSLYAATKITDELISYTYSHLYKIPTTGLRFFTVYGEWGRPDMAVYGFTKAINEGSPIKLFNFGKMKRDFTYISDVVDGIIAATNKPPIITDNDPPYALYNLGNHNPIDLQYFVSVIEQALGKKAKIIYEEMQKGDMLETYADITKSQTDLHFTPATPIEKGIENFVKWYLAYIKH